MLRMKYPPFSWLRLSEEIKPSSSRIWFSFDKLPKEQLSCIASVFIASKEKSYHNPYDALGESHLLLPRQQKVLELFLALAKPTKSKNEFIIDYLAFSKLLPYSSAIPFEIAGLGVLVFAQSNATIKSSLTEDENKTSIIFSVTKNTTDQIENPQVFGDINSYIIDNEGKIYQVVPPITPSEVKAIITSPTLALLGLCQAQSRKMFYSLSRLGVDFSALDKIAKTPENYQIFLRILLEIDNTSKKLSVRAHLVSKLSYQDFSDEVEIKSTGSIPAIHIAAEKNLDEEKYIENISIPPLLKRAEKEERDARSFLYHLGASPAKFHDGFQLEEESAFALLKAICEGDILPSYIKLDDNTKPELIYLPKKPSLKIDSDEITPTRIDVSLSLGKEYDNAGTPFKKLLEAKDNLLVIDQDTLAISNNDLNITLNYLIKTISIDEPNTIKRKSVAQIALIINALTDKIDIIAKKGLVKFLEDFSIRETPEDSLLPEGLVTTLRPYQHDAVKWLSALRRSGLGGLLGDEMGLGKTLMLLTHLAKLKESGLSKNPSLVVCPTSVMDVWVLEAQKHVPGFRVMKWHGLDRLSGKDEMLKNDIVVTSYAILRRDIEGPLKDIEFSTLILDEAQFIRNEQTDSFRAAKKVKCAHRIALTGTPIENHVSDLYNILDCVEEGILGPKKAFEQQFSNLIDEGPNLKAMNLKMLISPIVTRRRKAEVENELPPKIENIVYCALTKEQKVLYNKYVSQISNNLSKETHFSLLSSLTRLRQICCHPSLITEEVSEENASGKFIALREILTECLEMGRKIIIYSQFIKMQELIVRLAFELDQKGALWLHGSTQNRDEIVRSFQDENGPRMIVVSLKAGGTGITLTQADTVIFADPWWNPAVEDQAIDRAHRIGQKKTVHVIRLIAEESIEQEVVALAQRKKAAAHSLLHDGFRTTSNLTKEEVQSLLAHELERLHSIDP